MSSWPLMVRRSVRARSLRGSQQAAAVARAIPSALPAVESHARLQSLSASASARLNRADTFDMSTTLEREQTVTSPIAPALAGLALSDAIADVAAEIKPSVVLIGQGGSHGAGVIWR